MFLIPAAHPGNEFASTPDDKSRNICAMIFTRHLSFPCAWLGLTLALSACSHRQPEVVTPSCACGVLLTSEQSASTLPKVPIPALDFTDATVEEFITMFGDKALGNLQWSASGVRIQFTCAPEVKHRRFTLNHREQLTALDALTLFAQASRTVVEATTWPSTSEQVTFNRTKTPQL
jgi:hypothetical protein